PVHLGQVRGVRTVVGGVDVPDHDGAGRRAVALPELPAVAPVIGGEEQRPVDVGYVGETGTAATVQDDVRDPYGAGLGAVTLPQRGTGRSPDLEEERPVYIGQV